MTQSRDRPKTSAKLGYYYFLTKQSFHSPLLEIQELDTECKNTCKEDSEDNRHSDSKS